MADGTYGGQSVKITLMVEGKTERVFLPHLRNYLQQHLAGRMPTLDPAPYDGRIPTGDKLARTVQRLLSGRFASDHVIALTDVYTGRNSGDFRDAADAKLKMRQWVGNDPRFHPHAAQYDFEAWLLPYWSRIQELAGHNRTRPNGSPEQVNHTNPPSYHIRQIFRNGNCRDDYVKPRDAGRILQDQDLSLAINQCNELKALINSILEVCDGEPIP